MGSGGSQRRDNANAGSRAAGSTGRRTQRIRAAYRAPRIISALRRPVRICPPLGGGCAGLNGVRTCCWVYVAANNGARCAARGRGASAPSRGLGSAHGGAWDADEGDALLCPRALRGAASTARVAMGGRCPARPSQLRGLRLHTRGARRRAPPRERRCPIVGAGGQ